MSGLDLRRSAHRRFNPLTRDWVIVSPQRTSRPWLGAVEAVSPARQPAYDPDCTLCPRNVRASGARNPDYAGTFVFDNDFPALTADGAPGSFDDRELLVAASERGICRVACFSPRHDLTLPTMDQGAVRAVVDMWVAQVADLAEHSWVRHVQIFENRGAMMGASNPHPHCQIWACESIPNEPRRELAAQEEYARSHGDCLLCDYQRREIGLGERLICDNRSFIALVPFWAVWPFEALVLPRRHVAAPSDLTDAERDDLAAILKRLTTRFDNLFAAPFPYSMGLHAQPIDGQAHPDVHLHAHFYPPLLRSASVRKFMVGFELLAAPQRDITAEQAAERLRTCSEVHYAVAGPGDG